MASPISLLNDQLRQSVPSVRRPNRLILTEGVGSLDILSLSALLAQVRSFDRFTPDNDPHGEHDFGSIEHQGTRYFWKIDYYDRNLECHSPDAADPAVTSRVLTIMRADEY